MRISVLGPMMITHDDRAVVLPSAPKCKQLLALFLLNVNTLVTADACVEELWHEAPPKSALSTLQTYVLQIRRSLRSVPSPSSARAEPLITRNRGYLFTADPEHVDHLRFEHITAEARQAVRKGDDELASRRFIEALDLWRGPVAADVRPGPLTAAHRVGLEEARLSALEQRIEADLRLGRHRLLLDELDDLVVQYPEHENICAQYMIALSRSGQVDRALEVYRELRDRLVGKLGLEPSQALHELSAQLHNPDLAPYAQYRHSPGPATADRG